MTGNPDMRKERGSFRDPCGFIFYKDGSIYRQINDVYKENYDHLISSSLYQILVDEGLMISHVEINKIDETDERDPDETYAKRTYKTIRPITMPFISYPYEWCFSQLKDAALTTLTIQKKCLEYGMSLKDASAYNIQFLHGKPVFIDTLSFEKYTAGQPWKGYGQFCRHFLAPLALMTYSDVRLNQLMRIFIDGIPLDMASRLLPFKTYLRFALLSHIHIHARSQKHFANNRGSGSLRKKKMSDLGMSGIIESLLSIIKKLEWHPKGFEWQDYYDLTHYTDAAIREKKDIVSGYLKKIRPLEVWDIGANTGMFSRLAAKSGANVISLDMDPACVEKNYLAVKTGAEKKILPLTTDFNNPSPGIGWQNRERMSLLDRGPVDTLLALALIHHLAISNNLPLEYIADFFASMANHLIVEFVPKEDPQVRRLLSTRKDIYPGYTQGGFEKAFKTCFTVQHALEIKGTHRTVYLMSKNRK